MDSKVSYPKKQAVHFLHILPRTAWAPPLFSIASWGAFPSNHVIGELAACVLLSSLLKIICGLCVFTQYRLAGWGWDASPLAHHRLGSLKIKLTSAMQSSHAPLWEQGERLWHPAHPFTFNSGLHTSEQGAEKRCLSCEILAFWEDP